MQPNDPVAKSTEQALPILFAKRRPVDAEDAREYAGTDTERDIKG